MPTAAPKAIYSSKRISYSTNAHTHRAVPRYSPHPSSPAHALNQTDIFYFEVSLVASSSSSELASPSRSAGADVYISFAEKGICGVPGLEDSRSIAVWGRNGKVFWDHDEISRVGVDAILDSDVVGRAALCMQHGDIVGLGIVASTGRAFLTHNGHFGGWAGRDAESWVMPNDPGARLYPCVALKHAGDLVSLNFEVSAAAGKPLRPFVYDLTALPDPPPDTCAHATMSTLNHSSYLSQVLGECGILSLKNASSCENDDEDENESDSFDADGDAGESDGVVVGGEDQGAAEEDDGVPPPWEVAPVAFLTQNNLAGDDAHAEHVTLLTARQRQALKVQQQSKARQASTTPTAPSPTRFSPSNSPSKKTPSSTRSILHGNVAPGSTRATSVSPECANTARKQPGNSACVETGSKSVVQDSTSASESESETHDEASVSTCIGVAESLKSCAIRDDDDEPMRHARNIESRVSIKADTVATYYSDGNFATARMIDDDTVNYFSVGANSEHEQAHGDEAYPASRRDVDIDDPLATVVNLRHALSMESRTQVYGAGMDASVRPSPAHRIQVSCVMCVCVCVCVLRYSVCVCVCE